MCKPLVLNYISANSITRQFPASIGLMTKNGANHLGSVPVVGVLNEYLNANGLALKEGELNRVDFAIRNVLHSYIRNHIYLPTKIDMPCYLAGQKQTLVLRHIEIGQGHVELLLAEQGGALEGIKNFNDLYERLNQELNLNINDDVDDTDSDVNSSTEVMHYIQGVSESSELNETFESSDEASDSESVEGDEAGSRSAEIACPEILNFDVCEVAPSLEYLEPVKFRQSFNVYDFPMPHDYSSGSASYADLYY